MQEESHKTVVADLILDGKPHNGRKEYREWITLGGRRLLLGGQRLMIALALLFEVVVFPVGRRVGKSVSLMFLCMEEQARSKGRYVHGYVAPDHPKAKEAYENFIAAFGGDPKRNPNSLVCKVHPDQGQDRWFDTKPLQLANGHSDNTGGRYYFWSGQGEAAEHIRGFMFPFNRISVDEAKDIARKLITRILMPMLTDHPQGGRLGIYGTPGLEGIGNVWFEGYFKRGQMKTWQERGYASRTFPSECNPLVPLENTKRGREGCITKDEESQEYDAVFIQGAGQVFERLNPAFSLCFALEQPAWVQELLMRIPVMDLSVWIHEDPKHGRRYVMGVDWAKKADAAVISIWDVRYAKQVALFRFKGTDYEEQIAYVKHLHVFYNNAVIHSDANGVGASMTERLARAYGEGVVEHIFTGANKAMYVRRAAIVFKGERWKFIDVEEQKEEFRIFAEFVTKSGHSTFRHPDDEHDDFVDAAMMIADSLEYYIAPMERVKQGPAEGTLDALLAKQAQARFLANIQKGQIA